METREKSYILISGLAGLVAAILVGTGEFLLHYDPLARFSETSYDFMQAASDSRQTIGHFFGVLAAPLYVVGCWHIYLMLKPGGNKLAFFAFVISAYGFMIGADWISSRASIGAITHLQLTSLEFSSLIDLYRQHIELLFPMRANWINSTAIINGNNALLSQNELQLSKLVELYQLRYESLLTIIRITTLVLSLTIVFLVLKGRTHYSKWMALFNPLVLLLMNFVIYLIMPQIGKYMMPIALNIGFGLFFILSLIQANKIQTNS